MFSIWHFCRNSSACHQNWVYIITINYTLHVYVCIHASSSLIFLFFIIKCEPIWKLFHNSQWFDVHHVAFWCEIQNLLIFQIPEMLRAFLRVIIKKNTQNMTTNNRTHFNTRFYENELTLCFHTTLYAGGLPWTRRE